MDFDSLVALIGLLSDALGVGLRTPGARTSSRTQIRICSIPSPGSISENGTEMLRCAVITLPAKKLRTTSTAAFRPSGYEADTWVLEFF